MRNGGVTVVSIHNYDVWIIQYLRRMPQAKRRVLILNREELEKEIEYVDRIKRKFSSGKNEENLPTNIKRIHNKWKEEITQKAIESCPDVANIFNIINESKILEESEA